MPLVASVVIPTHNPHAGRLARTLAGLRAQTLAADQWECLLVDNASSAAVDPASLVDDAPSNLRVVREPTLGLSSARRRGFAAAKGAVVVLVDDDNVLAPNYLSDVARIFDADPKLGAAGGPSRPEFETPPEAWTREFFPLLALRDLGAKAIIAGLARSPEDTHYQYPPSAPIGAGMALRRAAVAPWLESQGAGLSDRRGTALTSGGDNDIVLSVLHGGWQVGYFPELALTHLIPAGRLDPHYLARLNRGIQKSWVEVLARHGANPWSAVPRWTVPLRQAKAWFTYRAWKGLPAQIRWQGACGHFEGRGAISPMDFHTPRRTGSQSPPSHDPRSNPA